MDIRSYLIETAERITSNAPRHLPPLEDWEAWRKHRQREYLHWMGLDRYFDAPRTPLNKKVTRVHERKGYRIECIAFESLPGLWVEANLYIPDGANKGPALVYACGHSDLQKAAYYQDHARKYAQLGFTTLIYDTIQLGEVRGYHHGTHRYGWFHWISRGFTPAAVEVWNGVRALDLLAELPEVDPSRLGVTGNSGGGAVAWWLAAADDRVRAVSPSCGTGTIASHIRERTLDGHCDCMFPINTEGWALSDFASLIAPRPVFIVSAAKDSLFSIDSIEDFHRRLSRVYDHLGCPEALELFTFPHPHGYNAASRRRTFQWFLKQLQGQDVALEDVTDIDEQREEPETLAVYMDGLPVNDRSTNVHDWFVPRAELPQIEDGVALESERERVISSLKELTFATFPDPLPDPDPTVSMESYGRAGLVQRQFEVATEGGLKLGGELRLPAERPTPAPVVLELPSPGETRSTSYTLCAGAPADWIQGSIAPRGTGSTAWSPALHWHLRRAAALTGRTLASLRVIDVLHGLAAVRTVEDVDPAAIYVTAQGEMAAVALYAALLDGTVAGLILHDPPATQNAPDSVPGEGPCIEMLNVLRVTDLPQVAGLLWPTKLIFVNGRPDSYLWAEELYTRLGAPGGFWNVPHLRHWRAEG